MPPTAKGPKILIVTPEIAFLPRKMGFPVSARCGGLADVSAALVDHLSRAGVDVHVALPEYRFIFQQNAPGFDSRSYFQAAQCKGLHLVRERAFCSTDRIYSENPGENVHRSLVFQREVINHIIPLLQPDLIHCHDWMTGLLPAVCRIWGIPCLFTLHSEHTARCTLAQIEDRGIDAALFWQHLYYADYPGTYEQTRNTLPVDFLASGVFSASLVNNGGGFLFDEFDADRLDSTVHQAISFHHLPAAVKAQQVSRTMMQSGANISNPVFNRRHMRLYESILGRPLRSRVMDRRRPANKDRETLNTKSGWPSRSRWQLLSATAGLTTARARAFA